MNNPLQFLLSLRVALRVQRQHQTNTTRCHLPQRRQNWNLEVLRNGDISESCSDRMLFFSQCAICVNLYTSDTKRGDASYGKERN